MIPSPPTGSRLRSSSRPRNAERRDCHTVASTPTSTNNRSKPSILASVAVRNDVAGRASCQEDTDANLRFKNKRGRGHHLLAPSVPAIREDLLERLLCAAALGERSNEQLIVR